MYRSLYSQSAPKLPVAEPITLPDVEDLAYIRKPHLKPYKREPLPLTQFLSYLSESDL